MNLFWYLYCETHYDWANHLIKRYLNLQQQKWTENSRISVIGILSQTTFCRLHCILFCYICKNLSVFQNGFASMLLLAGCCCSSLFWIDQNFFFRSLTIINDHVSHYFHQFDSKIIEKFCAVCWSLFEFILMINNLCCVYELFFACIQNDW